MAEQAQNLPATGQSTIAGALAIFAKAHPNEAKVIEGIYKKDVLLLGTDEAFALRDSEGEIRAYRRAIILSEKDGYLVQPVPGGPFVISAQGYEYWSECVGACVIMPPDVLVDGVRQQNPHVIRDPNNRRILAIYARAVAFRFSPMGLPMVSDWTTIFDNPSYRLIDLLAKAKKFPQAFRLLPVGVKPNGEGATWASYPFDESTELWVNTQHEEALGWYSTIINREKKSIDFAQTFAKRNALKHLSGLQRAPGNVWRLTITAWKATAGNIIKWDSTQYANVQNVVQRLTAGDRKEFKVIEQTAGRELVDNEDVTEQEETGEHDEAIDITSGSIKNGKEAPDNPALTDDEKKTMANLAVAKGEFKAEYLAACQAAGIEPDAKVSPTMAKAIMQHINNILDGRG